jgi:glutamine synthetase
MDVMRRTAEKYGLACLLHEKPFAGINGSGKHNNWSMSTDTGEILLEPGQTPHDNAQVLVFCVAVISRVAKYPESAPRQRASAGNDHRVGATEAPPGDHLDLPGRPAPGHHGPVEKGKPEKTLPGGVHGGGRERAAEAAAGRRRPQPHLSRSRFTGNKFEFRAVGSSFSIAGPNTVLNTIVAESIDFIATALEKARRAAPRCRRRFRTCCRAS